MCKRRDAQMYICSAILKNQENQECPYKVVTDNSEVNINSEPIIVHYKDHPSGACIVNAIINDEYDFTCNGESWTIEHFAINDFLKQKKLEHNRSRAYHIDNFDICAPENIVYIYQFSAICPYCKYHGKSYKPKNVTVTVPCLNNINIKVDINIQYCENCERYFTNTTSLYEYEARYGFLLFQHKYEDKYNANIYDTFYEEDTVLSRYGYTVKKNKLSIKQRRNILKFLIDTNTATKSEIIHILSCFTKRKNNPKFFDAIHEWKSDLLFVNEYSKDSQKNIGEGILRYHSR